MQSINNSLKNIQEFRKSWNESVKAQALPTLSFDWFLTCEEAFSPNTSITLIVWSEHQNGEISAAIPLVKRHCIFGKCSFEILGESFLHEPTGFIYRDEKSFGLLMQAIKRLESPILFQRIPESLSIRKYFTRPISKKFLFFEKRVTGSQYLLLPKTIEEFEKGMSSRRRGDLNRIRRKASSLGELGTEIIQPNAINLEKTIQLAFEIEHAGWKAKTQSSILSRAHIENFFRIYLKKLATRGQLVVGFLKCNNEAVAMQIAISSLGRMWLLKIGHKDEYKHISPGILMTHEMIRYAIKEDMQAFEFMGSCESWIKMWNPKAHEYKAALIFPVNISGLLHFVKVVIEVIFNKFTK